MSSWTGLSNLEYGIRAKKNLVVNWDLLSKGTHLGGQYLNTQFFTNIFETVSAEILGCGTVFTYKKNHWVGTSRSLFPVFAVGSWPRISTAPNYSGAVVGNSCMSSMFRGNSYPVLSADDTAFYNRIAVEWHVRPEVSVKELIKTSSQCISCHFGVNTQLQYA